MSQTDALAALGPTERDSLKRYLDSLIAQLGGNLVQIWLFGSAARGDMWPHWSQMHSDIDLLVLTREPVPPNDQEDLVNATYPLFLECGRQISPNFLTLAQFEKPESERRRDFVDRVRTEGHAICAGP